MAAYNWLVILLCMGCFGLLYASTYDVVAELHENAYTGDDNASMGVNILWLGWKYLPVVFLISMAIYGFMSAQKTEGGGWN